MSLTCLNRINHLNVQWPIIQTNARNYPTQQIHGFHAHSLTSPLPLLTPPSPFSPALVKNKDFRKVFVEGLGVFRNFYFGGDCVGWYHGILIEN